MNAVVPNYSTMLAPPPLPSPPPQPCSTNLTSLTSGGVLSACSNITASGPSLSHIIDQQQQQIQLHQYPQKSHPPPQQLTTTATTTQSPAVCGFSGLPLFPPETSRETNSPSSGNIRVVSPPTTTTTTSNTSSSMEENNNNHHNNNNNNNSAATAWIDGIIKDLIHSSSNVSIPQLIQNVRDIIFPCNPNLATLLEYRLRSIISEAAAPLPPPLMPHNLPITTSSSASQPPFGHDHLYLHWGGVGCGGLVPGASPLPPTAEEVHNQQQQQQEQENSSPAVEEAITTTTTTTTNTPQQNQALLIREKKEELRQQKRDEEGLHLLTLLLQCAEAVSADNFDEANKILLEISELSTPFGTSAQRVAAYFSEAMSARLVSSCLGIYAALPASSIPTSHTQKMASAFQVFNGISPFVKFSHFTANQAIQEAFEREERVHIIDLDIMQGLQWPGLFHILASRPGGPPYVRLTGLGTSMEALEATGKRLSDFADKLGLPFEFFPVAEKVGTLDPERLNVSKREAVAVHWLQHSLYDVTGSDTNTLWLLQR